MSTARKIDPAAMQIRSFVERLEASELPSKTRLELYRSIINVARDAFDFESRQLDQKNRPPNHLRLT